MRAVAAFALLLGSLALSHALRCTEAPQIRHMRQIDAGQGKVVATDRYNRAYFLSGSSWYRLGSIPLSHVSVGPAGIWGVRNNGWVYKFMAGNFRRASVYGMRQVDAGGPGQIVGVSRSSTATCVPSGPASLLSGIGNLRWRTVGGGVIYHSCGPKFGCWAINSRQRILFTRTLIPTNCARVSWTYVSGSLRMIEVGTDGSVYGVNRLGNVYQRIGITARRPQGSRWHQIRTCMPIKHLTYDLKTLWLQTTSNSLLQCAV